MSDTDEEKTEMDQETAFLHQLAGVLRTTTDEEVDEMIANSVNARKAVNQIALEVNKKAISREGDDDSNSNQKGEANVSYVSEITDADITMVSNRESNEDDNPTVISATSVVEMFSQLKQEITQKIDDDHAKLRVKIKEDLKDIHSQCYKKLKENITPILKNNQTFKQMETDLQFYKIRAETLSEVCERMHTEISDLTTRVENLEISSSKKMVIMTGLSLVYENKKKETLQFLNDFINTNLGLNINIDDYFTLGAANPRPIILILQTIDDKKKILSTKSYLKDIRDGERRIYINEYYPPTTHEKKKRDLELVDQLKDSNMITYVKGSLAVDGQIYRKQVLPPSPKELINLNPKEMEEILKLKTMRGAEFTKENSKFIAYVAPVHTHEDVNKVYKKIKLIKPDARHIVCAYWIKEDSSTPPQYIKDFQDDGEPGAGRVLLDILEDRNLNETAIFVARKYGGTKMGADRFTMYSYAAKSALGIELSTVIEKKRLYKKANYGQQNQQIRNFQGGTHRGQRGGRVFNNVRGAHQSQNQTRFMNHKQTWRPQQQSYGSYVNNTQRQQTPYRQQMQQMTQRMQYPTTLPPHLVRMTAPRPLRPPGLTAYPPLPSQQNGQFNNQQFDQGKSSQERMDFTFSNPQEVCDSDVQETEEWTSEREGAWTDSETELKRK